jgi:putative hemolysin
MAPASPGRATISGISRYAPAIASALEAVAEALETRARQGYANGVASDLAAIAAARLFGAAEALLERSHTVLAPADLLAYERDVATLRARLPASELDAA